MTSKRLSLISRDDDESSGLGDGAKNAHRMGVFWGDSDYSTDAFETAEDLLKGIDSMGSDFY